MPGSANTLLRVSCCFKDKEIAALTASNEELDVDIERATVSIDEFEKQERDTRERYAELEHEMLTLEAELTSMKAQRDEFESVHDQEVTRHRMHVVECDTATLRLQNAVEEQIAIVAGKDAKIKDGKFVSYTFLISLDTAFALSSAAIILS